MFRPKIGLKFQKISLEKNSHVMLFTRILGKIKMQTQLPRQTVIPLIPFIPFPHASVTSLNIHADCHFIRANKIRAETHSQTYTPQRSLWRGSVCICPSAPLLAAVAGQNLLASAGNSPEPYRRYLKNTQYWELWIAYKMEQRSVNMHQ